MLDSPRSNNNGSKPHQDMIAGAFLRNAWYVAAWADELDGGRLLPRTIMNEPIVLFRKATGEVAAIEDRCAHRFAPLSMGKIVGGDRIQCPYHGLEFDGTGACVRNPHGTKNIPSRAKVRSYPAVEKHQAVWLWMGAAPAEPGKIPDFS
ncbi:MAG TPA: Rieske 2Fe-2S domain-containing protein, partial [Xanthobacteraceae bacterium]|nr:Rieske 2Fe-2S domain-containing protein [Xanthobacteraceae bacterium]